MTDLTCWRDSSRLPRIEHQLAIGSLRDSLDLRNRTVPNLSELVTSVDGNGITGRVPEDGMVSVEAIELWMTGRSTRGPMESLSSLAAAFLEDFEVPLDRIPLPTQTLSSVIVMRSSDNGVAVWDLHLDILRSRADGHQPMQLRLKRRPAEEVENVLNRPFQATEVDNTLVSQYMKRGR